jgi:enterochelin esterase-like enzyme
MEFRPGQRVEVAGNGPQFYDAKPVPHGEVRIRPYESKALGLARTVWVYTPPGYDQGKDYPVLYLLHGVFEVSQQFRRGQQAVQTVLDRVGEDDTLTGPGDRDFDRMLTRIGITHTFRVTEGRHEWTVWRHHLNEVAPLLFK